jgi:hypothetical protein
MISDVFAERTTGLTGSFIDQIMSLVPERGGAGRADVISFGDGSPRPDALPIEAFRELAGAVFAEEACPALNYGPTEGDAELRARLLELLAHFGAGVTQEQLVITNGGMQGLDLACKLFVNPGLLWRTWRSEVDCSAGRILRVGHASGGRGHGSDVQGRSRFRRGVRAGKRVRGRRVAAKPAPPKFLSAQSCGDERGSRAAPARLRPVQKARLRGNMRSNAGGHAGSAVKRWRSRKVMPS